MPSPPTTTETTYPGSSISYLHSSTHRYEVAFPLSPPTPITPSEKAHNSILRAKRHKLTSRPLTPPFPLSTPRLLHRVSLIQKHECRTYIDVVARERQPPRPPLPRRWYNSLQDDVEWMEARQYWRRLEKREKRLRELDGEIRGFEERRREEREWEPVFRIWTEDKRCSWEGLGVGYAKGEGEESGVAVRREEEEKNDDEDSGYGTLEEPDGFISKMRKWQREVASLGKNVNSIVSVSSNEESTKAPTTPVTSLSTSPSKPASTPTSTSKSTAPTSSHSHSRALPQAATNSHHLQTPTVKARGKLAVKPASTTASTATSTSAFDLLPTPHAYPSHAFIPEDIFFAPPQLSPSTLKTSTSISPTSGTSNTSSNSATTSRDTGTSSNGISKPTTPSTSPTSVNPASSRTPKRSRTQVSSERTLTPNELEDGSGCRCRFLRAIWLLIVRKWERRKRRVLREKQEKGWEKKG